MGKIYYGCDELARGFKSYFNLCNALEIDVESLDAPPKLATLNRWRVDSPRGFCFMVRAGQEFVDGLTRLSDRGATELDDRVRQSWQTTVERAHALAAKAIVVPTSFEFTPGSASRTLLQRVGDELAQPIKQAVIWQSQGPWPLAETRDFAHECGLVYAYDPFIADREEIPPSHGDTAWVLTERAALRRKFDQFDMERLIDWSEHYDRAFVLLHGRFKWDHARELQVALDYAP